MVDTCNKAIPLQLQQALCVNRVFKINQTKFWELTSHRLGVRISLEVKASSQYDATCHYASAKFSWSYSSQLCINLHPFATHANTQIEIISIPCSVASRYIVNRPLLTREILTPNLWLISAQNLVCGLFKKKLFTHKAICGDGVWWSKHFLWE